MQDILIGTTNHTVLVFIPDPASTTGVGKTGLAAAAVTVTYTRVETDNDVVHTDVTGSMNDLTNLTDAHNDWGWKEVSSSLSKGLYRLDLADALFDAGAWYTVVQVTITSGTAAATPKGFRLVSRNDLDGVRLGLTALPNAAAEAAGGLYTRGSGAGQINQNANGQVDTRVVALDEDSATLDLDSTIRGAVGLATANLDTQLDALPTAAENADAVWDEDATGHQTGGTFGQAIGDPGASTETLYKAIVTDPAGTNIAADIIAIKAETAAIVADTNELQTDWVNGGRLDLLLDATLADTNELQTDWTNGGRLDLLLDATLADTNELQTDWVNGGRLDLILDARASQTSVDDLPTNAELATALGTADDAVLAAINDLPTNAELATALGTADDAVLAQIALVKAKTDSLTFTVAGSVDANIQRVNDVEVTGDGEPGTEWGPA